jgi:hypothetical protein
MRGGELGEHGPAEEIFPDAENPRSRAYMTGENG